MTRALDYGNDGGSGWYGTPGGGGPNYIPAGGSNTTGSGTTKGNCADTQRSHAGNSGAINNAGADGRVVVSS